MLIYSRQEFTSTIDHGAPQDDDVISISSTEDVNPPRQPHAVVKHEDEDQDEVISISSSDEDIPWRHQNAVVKREHGEEEEEDEEDYNGPVFA